MIRALYIGDRLRDGHNDLVFYDTDTDRFIEFQGVQIFNGWEVFCELYEPGKYLQHTLDRFCWSCHTTSA